MSSEDIPNKIESKYDKYLSESDRGFFDDEHLGDIIRGRGSGWAEGNVGDLARECWITFDNEIPDMAALPVSVLELLPVQLTRTIRVQVTDDHRQYWAWTAAVMDEINDEDSVIGENIDRHFKMLVDLILSKITSRPTDLEDQQRNRQIEDSISPHTQRLTTRHYPVIATYYSYPILEGMLKRLSSSYIRPNGEIRSDQFIQGMHHRYVPPGNSKCSSIRDLLYHYHTIVASGKMSSKLDYIQPEIEVLGDGNMYEMVGRWRNLLLHGQELGGVEAGVLLNLICVLLWGEIDTESYQNNWDDLYERIISIPQPFRYYPAI